ncbi:MAG: hypothetical protein MJE68_12035, partial [Proteobacteria bacterium]|nr:hypothetical protein [Pseudomonadota bacterium]
MAGLTGFKNIGWKLVHKANNNAVITNFNYLMFIIRCLYELQKKEQIMAICDDLFLEETPKIIVNTPLDCYLAGYCIAASGIGWCFSSIGDGDQSIEMLSLGFRSVTDSITESEVYLYGSIDRLGLSISVCTKKVISHLNNFIPFINNELYLDVLDSSAFDELSELVPRSLKTLTLANYPGGEGAMVKLIPKLTQLQSLDISWITLGLRDVQALSALLKSSKCLEELTIGDPYMTEECVSLMIKVLLSPSSLKNLTISSVEWTTGNSGNFMLLESNNNIQSLHFNKFHKEFEYDHRGLNLNPVIPAVAKALHKNDSLIHLGIPPCKKPCTEFFEIKRDSVVALSEMLRVNT